MWEVVKREVDLKQQEAKLRTFDTAFQRIRGKTGIETIDEMVTEFCDAEDHNFSLINIINGLTKVRRGVVGLAVPPVGSHLTTLPLPARLSITLTH